MPSRASKTTKPCECGCGTPIPELGYNGKPRRFAKGHAGRVYYKGRVKPWLQASNEQKKPRHTNRGGIEGKACSLCITWKPLTEYSPRNGGQIENRCRACSAKRSLAYYHRHRDAIRKQRRSEEYKKYLRPYQAKWIKDRCQQDPGFRICRQLRSRINRVLKHRKKSKKTKELIGCTLPELVSHLESQFATGMSWDNYGRGGWEIDHIRPCASFDLSNPEELAACFHYTNLQPMWGPDNWKKSKRWNGKWNHRPTA